MAECLTRGGVFECFELTGTIRLEASVEENRSNHVILMVLRDDGKKQLREGKYNPTTAAFAKFQPPGPGLHCTPLRVRRSTQHTAAV